jgi:hypothetical protein
MADWSAFLGQQPLPDCPASINQSLHADEQAGSFKEHTTEPSALK